MEWIFLSFFVWTLVDFTKGNRFTIWDLSESVFDKHLRVKLDSDIIKDVLNEQITASLP